MYDNWQTEKLGNENTFNLIESCSTVFNVQQPVIQKYVSKYFLFNLVRSLNLVGGAGVGVELKCWKKTFSSFYVGDTLSLVPQPPQLTFPGLGKALRGWEKVF